MSMTREEAIISLESIRRFKEMCGGKDADGIEALDLAIAALRGPTREMVERMRGEWMFPIFANQQDTNDPRCQCSECGSIETPLARHRFCPACGAPMTAEAVEMVMKRLDDLYGQENP